MTVAVLWIAQILLFVVGYVGPWRDSPQGQANGRVPRQIRMLLSGSLAGAALLIWRHSTAATSPYTGWVLGGMCASCVGDLIMAKLIPLPNRLIGGMIAFATAHACYITAFINTAAHLGGTVINGALWFGLGAYGVTTMGGWWSVIRNPDQPALLNAGALLYGLWISVMAAFALALAWAVGGTWWVAAVGGVVFMASDFLIGVTDIHGTTIKNAHDWIWVTYVGGQMGIVYAGWL